VSQQINLYQPIFRKQKKIFSAKTLLQASAMLIAALLLIYGYGRWQVFTLNQELTHAKSQLTASQRRVAEMRRLNPPKVKDQRLEKTSKRLQKELDTKRRVIAVLSGKSFGNTAGFADYFEGLARQHVAGMWLTGLKIQDGGTHLELSGSTLRPALVPRFLQHLGGEAPFAGMRFDTFKMSRDKHHTHWVDFVLKSRGEGSQ